MVKLPAWYSGGHCLDAAALEYASRIAQKTGATLLAETFKARFARGAGRVAVTPIPYPGRTSY